MYNYVIFKKSVIFSHPAQTSLFQDHYQAQVFETMKIPKSLILECAEKIKKTDVKIPEHELNKKTI